MQCERFSNVAALKTRGLLAVGPWATGSDGGDVVLLATQALQHLHATLHIFLHSHEALDGLDLGGGGGHGGHGEGHRCVRRDVGAHKIASPGEAPQYISPRG